MISRKILVINLKSLLIKFDLHSFYFFNYYILILFLFSIQHFIRLAASQGFNMEVIAELKYELPKVHKFHKQKSKDIEVDLYRFSHNS